MNGWMGWDGWNTFFLIRRPFARVYVQTQPRPKTFFLTKTRSANPTPKMKLELIVILALVFFIVLAVFVVFAQRRALKTASDDKEELLKKLEEATFQARELERTQESEGGELKGKVEEQEKQIEEMQANFEATINRKNEHFTATANQLKAAEEANAALSAEVQRLRVGVQNLLAEREQMLMHQQASQASQAPTHQTPTQQAQPHQAPTHQAQPHQAPHPGQTPTHQAPHQAQTIQHSAPVCDPVTGTCTVGGTVAGSGEGDQEAANPSVANPPTFPASLFAESTPASSPASTTTHVDGTGPPPPASQSATVTASA